MKCFVYNSLLICLLGVHSLKFNQIDLKKKKKVSMHPYVCHLLIYMKKEYMSSGQGFVLSHCYNIGREIKMFETIKYFLLTFSEYKILKKELL